MGSWEAATKGEATLRPSLHWETCLEISKQQHQGRGEGWGWGAVVRMPGP